VKQTKANYAIFMKQTLQTTLLVTSVKPVVAQVENFPLEGTKPMIVLPLSIKNCFLIPVAPFTTNLDPGSSKRRCYLVHGKWTDKIII
jgi:hypothetical protein